MGADQAKLDEIADIIDGQVVDASGRVAVSIKGTAGGYPATIEAIAPTWPFGVMYMVETNFLEGTSSDSETGTRITVYPRVGRGLASIVTRLLLFEGNGMSVGNKKLENMFNFSYDNRELAVRFVNQPGVFDCLVELEEHKFSELVVKTDAGVYLSQPDSFNSLDATACRKTIMVMARLAQIIAQSE